MKLQDLQGEAIFRTLLFRKDVFVKEEWKVSSESSFMSARFCHENGNAVVTDLPPFCLDAELFLGRCGVIYSSVIIIFSARFEWRTMPHRFVAFSSSRPQFIPCIAIFSYYIFKCSAECIFHPALYVIADRSIMAGIVLQVPGTSYGCHARAIWVPVFLFYYPRGLGEDYGSFVIAFEGSNFGPRLTLGTE